MNKTIVNFEDTLSRMPGIWSPVVISKFNKHSVMLDKIQGEAPWHQHDDADELLMVVKGTLKIHFRDKIFSVQPGECFVIPKGLEHTTSADEETHIIIIEPSNPKFEA